MEIRQFNIREADWEVDGNLLSNIRRIVFIVEQEVPEEEEVDGRDEECWHWIATDNEDVPIGTARLMPEGQIGRMAVLSDYRKYGIGAALLEAAVEKARHLGMNQVFLHAQTHALGFYERCGFIAEGEEFLEAGISHQHMIQNLAPPVDNIQRLTPQDSDLELNVKPFDASEVLWSEASGDIRRIRRLVFSTELGSERDIEEEDDSGALHWLAANDEGHPMGCIRMSPQGLISRLAILSEHRGDGVGSSLLELTLQRARRFGLTEVCYEPDDVVPEFLCKFSFEERDGKWIHTIEEEDRDVERRQDHGDRLAEDVTYVLGEDKQLILLRSETDFKNVILEMARQARQSIRIYSPLLDHVLFDQSELRDICSRLARRNKYTRVEILVFDPHRIVKHGHGLLNIARKLPSSIGIKVVDPEMRQLNHEYVLVDGEGVVYRGEYDKYEGTATFLNITECNRLGRQFTASWESGLLDPNLRQLRI